MMEDLTEESMFAAIKISKEFYSDMFKCFCKWLFRCRHEYADFFWCKDIKDKSAIQMLRCIKCGDLK